jgi:hypothetical protein
MRQARQRNGARACACVYEDWEVAALTSLIPLSRLAGEGKFGSPLPPCGRGAWGEGVSTPRPPCGRGAGGEGVSTPRPPCGRGAGGEGVSTPRPPCGRGAWGEGVSTPRPPCGRGAGGEGVSTPRPPQKHLHQQFRFGSGDERAAPDDKLQPVEPRAAGEVRQRLARGATARPTLQSLHLPRRQTRVGMSNQPRTLPAEARRDQRMRLALRLG